MNKRLIVALLSISLISLELIWTRLFSAEFYHAFAFLILSLAILGLGLGALAVRLIGPFNREGNLGPVLSLTGIAALAGPPFLFRLGLEFSKLFESLTMVGLLAVALVLLGSAFFFGGMALALVFRRNHQDMPRLYMADLAGSGAGVVLSVLMMNAAGTPAATALSALPVIIAALMATPGWRRLVPLGLIVAVVPLAFNADALLEVDRPERAPVVYKHWDAMAKIKMADFENQYRNINIDNLANTGIYRFDGNWDRPEEERFQFGIDVSNLISRFDGCRFASIGSGAGQDVLQALQAGAAEIHAVEVNPHINRMLLEGDPSGYLDNGAEMPMTLDEFTGNFYRDPRVKVVSEDARAYIGRFENHFDLIYSLSSNTFAALASGSFALAENYIFTTGAYQDYWRALSDDGFMMMEHQFYMPRLVPSLIDALEAEGVENPTEHFAIYDLPKMRRNMLLLSKKPLTDEIRDNAFGALTPDNFDQIHLLYPPAKGVEDNLIHRIVRNGWRSEAPTAPIDISPATDNRPFVGQLGLWRNLKGEHHERLKMLEVTGYPMSTVLILIILVVVLVLLVPLNLAPYLRRGPKLRAVPWLYFFLIGAGFMAIEVVLIQKYTLFVGPSVYSIATILFTLLLSSGIGSRFSTRFADRVPFLAILGWLLLDITLLPPLLRALSGLAMEPRIVLTAIIVAPLGFFMGMPFPKAALRVGELIDWGFAVNGAASVFGATGILLVAFNRGFAAALLVGGVLYSAAFVLLAWKGAWIVRPAEMLETTASSELAPTAT